MFGIFRRISPRKVNESGRSELKCLPPATDVAAGARRAPGFDVLLRVVPGAPPIRPSAQAFSFESTSTGMWLSFA